MSANTRPTQIGPYEIVREIGRGGMGVVYLARDTKLDRDVAIKALPEEMATDAQRLARFELEAKSLAALSHPNIAGIYGVEEQGGHKYLILEYVEGETLGERLDRGSIPVDEVLEIAIGITSGIEAAHEAGIIHRDVKPDNIKITPEGQVKVLDFGLARTDEGESGSSIANAATLTSPTPRSPTLPGAILGTAPYMSPEQARGRKVDKRTDIWSFGVLLYEMLTGIGPFQGESATDSMGAIMHRDPDWTALPQETPPTVQLLLRRCLTRDRNQRLKDIGDARIEINEALADPSSSSLGLSGALMTEPAKNRTRRRLLSVLALVAVAGAGAAAMWFATAPSRRPPPRTMQLVIPSRTNAYTNASKMVISPDGTRVAFAASRGPGDPRRLWVRRLGDFDARELDTETNTDVFWSHDGRYIGFHDDGKLWSIRADGADKHLLALIGGNSGATWNADGAIVLAGGEQGLRILHTDDSSIGSLTRLDTERFETAHARPHFLPDGNRYLYLALTFDPDQEIRSRLLYAGDLATGEQTLIGPFASAPWYVEPGYLVYVEDGTVKAVPFDAQRLRITGKPSILAQDAYYFRPTGNASISASRTGETVYLQTAPAQRLVWFDTDGNRLGQVGPAAAYDDDHRISPDGQTVAVTFLDPRTGLADIMLFDLQREMSRQLTFDAHWEGQPVWTPDGKTIYFSTDRHGWPDVFKVQLDGGAQSEVFRKANEWFPLDVSPNGRFLALSGRSEEAGRDIWIVPLDGENEPYAFSTMREDQRYARFSPDGTRIAYAGAEVYVDGFPDATSAIQVSSNGGFSPVWSPDGKKLYFGQRPTGDREWAVMSVEFDDSEARAPMAPSVLFTPGPFAKIEIAPDGERFLLRVLPDETPESRVILNWQSSLEEGATQ